MPPGIAPTSCTRLIRISHTTHAYPILRLLLSLRYTSQPLKLLFAVFEVFEHPSLCFGEANFQPLALQYLLPPHQRLVSPLSRSGLVFREEDVAASVFTHEEQLEASPLIWLLCSQFSASGSFSWTLFPDLSPEFRDTDSKV